MTINLEAIKAEWQSDRSAKHVPALVAEVERLRKVEAAANAVRDVMEADGVVCADEPCTIDLFAALDAAQGGG